VHDNDTYNTICYGNIRNCPPHGLYGGLFSPMGGLLPLLKNAEKASEYMCFCNKLLHYSKAIDN
jgi:hypothetical protein